jgi:Sulfotransferase domain
MGNIVWLASYPKSGNTWVRAFVHHLFRNPNEPLNINEIGGGQISTSEAQMRWYRDLDERPPESWTPGDIDRMRPDAQRLIAASFPGTVFCKTHCALKKSRGYPTVNLDVTAGAIYIVRNPLDIAVSYANFQGLDLDMSIKLMSTPDFELPNGPDNVSQPFGSWSENVASWTARPNDRLLVMRYEDMIGAPRDTFGRLVAFLGLEADAQRIDRAVESVSFAKMRDQEDRHGFNERSPAQERFFRAGTSGQWRAVFNDEQIAAMVAAHGEQMARFGYLPQQS